MQDVGLNVLIEIDKICRKHNIEYTLCGGTLIGVVRHKGFIPWDDDIDIIMTWENYCHFMDIAKKELPKHLFVENYDTEKECPFLFTKIIDTNTTFIDGVVEKFNSAKGLGVDIFPMFKISEKNKKKSTRIRKIVDVLLSAKLNVKHSNKIKLIIPFAKMISLHSIVGYYFKEMEKIDKQGGNYVVANYFKPEVFTDYSMFESGVTDMPFEGHKFSCMKEYDKYLSFMYGDYMKLPPIEEQQPHHYYKYWNANLPYEKYLQDNKKK